jgi:predicted RNase H-like HicB family nuclease
MSELVFDVMQESDGGYVAEALGENIFTQGETWEELRENVKDAVEGYFFDSKAPTSIRLRLVRDEVLITA